MAKTRVSVYIDGFNLYHSTLQFAHPNNRWLNLMELSKRIINPKTEEISEEKKTDINIAITLLADGMADNFDTALILSGDSDLTPAILKLKKLCPHKKAGIIVPQNQSAMNLKQHADFFKKIQDRDLKKSLLPEQITYKGNIITAPTGWLPNPKHTPQYL